MDIPVSFYSGPEVHMIARTLLVAVLLSVAAFPAPAQLPAPAPAAAPQPEPLPTGKYVPLVPSTPPWASGPAEMGAPAVAPEFRSQLPSPLPGAGAPRRRGRDTHEMAGPRVGLMYASGGIADKLRSEHEVSPLMTVFGWQFETRLFRTRSGLSGMTELVTAFVGAEQGLWVPTLTWLVAMRTPRGIEFGMGPNITPAGGSLVLAGGYSIPVDGVTFPLNAAVALSPDGTRVSLLTGFVIDW